MHVSHHLRPLALPLNPSAELRATHKKREEDDPDKVSPVRARADEDEQREQRRRQQIWQRSLDARSETVAHEPATEPEETPAAPSVAAAETVPAHNISPLDVLLAGITGDADVAPPASVTDAAQPSLDDLLALMRVKSQES
jgi:hypothetical protein